MRIQEAARMAGVSERTLRYYDRIGLLPPQGVTEAGYRIYGEAEWCGRKFTLIDTGGIEPRTDDQILSFMRSQAQTAIDTANVIIFLTDIKTGLTASDQEVANLLLRSGKPIVLAAKRTCEHNTRCAVSH